ncbi:unnamed protein product [Orchesella dallaii]|uniref:C2H2-type domain-containing protein n=1 Tax=Orchesella dallaii TaxID=48710 RepID=A0ABP1PSR4_9HEXA
MANDTNEPGSGSRWFCSFCQKKFNDDEPLRHHYQKLHSIVAIYQCQSCEQKFSLPSLFRTHIFTCDAILGLSLILNINLPLMDAFADYLGSRCANNAPKPVLQPGMPKYTRTAYCKFKVQSSYNKILKDWLEINHIDNAPSQPNLEVHDLEDSNAEESNAEESNPEESNVEDSNAGDSDVEDSNAGDSDVEDSNAGDSDEEEPNAEESNSEESNSEESNADDSNAVDFNAEVSSASSNPQRASVSMYRQGTCIDKPKRVLKVKSCAQIAEAEESEVEMEEPRRVTRAVPANIKRS